MSKLNIRCRFPKGQAVLENVTTESTLGQIKTQIEKKSGIAPSKQRYKLGYPPKYALENAKDEETLGALKIGNGETIIVEEGAHVSSTTGASTLKITPDKYSDSFMPKLTTKSAAANQALDGHCVHRVVPADNSCMFASLAYGLEGSQSRKRKNFMGMRNVISDFIQYNKDRYSDVVLGTSMQEYCKFIQEPQSWGGYLELSIFSEFYQVQICAWDIKSGRMDTYGHDYPLRVFLLYDGVHYDAAALNPIENGPEELDITIFSVKDTTAVNKMRSLVNGLRAKRKYTDLTDCLLRCNVCQLPLKGQKEAADHAHKTGHQHFVENV